MVVSAALVGFGAAARYGHLPWYAMQQSVKLTAVVEPTEGGRAAAQELLPNVQVFSNLDDLMKSQQVTFLDITAPPAAHEELILKASCGVHVICEKPFTTSLKSLEKINSTRSHGEQIIAACHNWYFAPAIRRGLEYVDAGLIGEPATVSFTAYRPQPAEGAHHWNPKWRQCASVGGGIIADLGYHGIYLASRIFQQAPRSAKANSFHSFASKDGAECDATLELDYGDDRRAELRLSWLSAVRETTLRVYGSQGNLTISGDSLRLMAAGKSVMEERFESLTIDSWHAAWTGETLDWFLNLTQAGDQEACWQDIVWSVSGLDAAYNSLRSGKSVAIQSWSPTHPVE